MSVWRALRDELQPNGVELITVGLDSLGADGCRAAIEMAQPSHPALIDTHHQMATRFGVVNIPQSIWIDEQGMIVRPVESAPPPPTDVAPPPQGTDPLPQRLTDIMAEAAQIETDPARYHHALRDWITKGSESQYALPPEAVIQRSAPFSKDRAMGHAHFELACEAVVQNEKGIAVRHFRAAHALVPDSWTYRRQAWSLEAVEAAGPFARFWQGPSPNAAESWPYDSDWLTDIRREGPANYYAPWQD
ncbi:MAG: hypothetical protein ACPH77_13035 [Pseudomonadales bacterium]